MRIYAHFLVEVMHRPEQHWAGFVHATPLALQVTHFLVAVLHLRRSQHGEVLQVRPTAWHGTHRQAPVEFATHLSPPQHLSFATALLHD